MTTYKLFQLIGTLSKTEKSLAEKYLASLGPKEEACLKLLRTSYGSPVLLDNTEQTKAVFFEALYPGERYDDVRMRKLMSRLLQLLEEFIIQQELSADVSLRRQLFLRSLSRRNDYGLFTETAEEHLKEMDRQPERGSTYLQEKYCLYHHLYYHPETYKLTRQHDYFQSLIQHLEADFMLASLMNGAESVIRNNQINAAEIPVYLAMTLQLAASSSGQPATVTDLFRRLFLLLHESEDFEGLEAIRDDIVNTLPLMSRHEQALALKLAIYHAAKFSNTGSRRHSAFVFEMYQLGVSKQLLQHGDNYVDIVLFLNIVYSACSNSALKWAQEFIQSNKQLLHKNDRTHTVNMAQASLYYHKGIQEDDTKKLYEAQKLLNKMPLRSEKFDLRVRPLELRIRFALFQRAEESLDEVLTGLRNFERYLKNNKVYSEQKKTQHYRFIEFFRRLARLCEFRPAQQDKVQRYMKDLNKEKNCNSKSWLKEQAEMLLPPPVSG